MIKEPSKHLYKTIRITDKNPISIMYKIFEVNGTTKLNIVEFERFFALWLLKSKRVPLMKGCLQLMNYFDKKFA